MLAQTFSIGDDFPAVGYDAWRAAVEADLKGAPFEKKLVTHTYEGVDILPLYTAENAPEDSGLPGLAPFTRGSRPLGQALRGWDVRQEHAHPDIDLTNHAILDDLARGVSSIQLRLDAAGRRGLDADAPGAADLAGRDGVMAYTLKDFDDALRGVLLDVAPIGLEAGSAFAPGAAMLAALWRERGVAPEAALGSFNADPLSVLARDGHLPEPLETMMRRAARLAVWTHERHPQATSIRVGTAPYHHAGATAAQDLAFAMGSGVEYLRALTGEGLSVDDASRQMLFSFAVGTHFFLASAKLRAARALWWRVVEASGGTARGGAMRMHVKTSKRVLTQRDPWVNVLRNAVACFAGAVAGADVVTSFPYDAAIGLPDASSRRLARITQVVLQEEARLHSVADPAGGSWFIERLTDQLCEAAWPIFQEIERRGGMRAALTDGWIAEQIDSAFSPRARDIARRKEAITGVSEFPNVREKPERREPPNVDVLRSTARSRLERDRASAPAGLGADASMDALVEAARAGASIGQLSSAMLDSSGSTEISPIHPHPFAEPFERLRDASDRHLALTGARPRVFLANLGAQSVHTPRATYAANFFEAGGFEVVSSEGFESASAVAGAFAESGARIAAICSSDGVYATHVESVAPALKDAGARTVVLAGYPGEREDAFRSAGVDRFIFIRCDVFGTLRELLEEEGVAA